MLKLKTEEPSLGLMSTEMLLMLDSRLSSFMIGFIYIKVMPVHGINTDELQPPLPFHSAPHIFFPPIQSQNSPKDRAFKTFLEILFISVIKYLSFKYNYVSVCDC